MNPDALSSEDAAYLEALCQAAERIAVAYALAQRFVAMVTTRQVDALDTWLADAQESSVSRLKTFAEGLRKDYDAIRAALEEQWAS